MRSSLCCIPVALIAASAASAAPTDHRPPGVLAPATALAPGEIQPVPGPLAGLLGDYDGEPRLPGGRVDVERLAARMQELHANTYFWLNWHAATDWDDLKLFLPAAARRHIRVWVYLVPPSESPPNAGSYSEPFRLDYPAWAEQIARLSVQNPNLVGWVIDDFHANPLFTPEYIRNMQDRAHGVAPRLLFCPLMYFDEVRPTWAEAYHGVIDGTVIAYPPDRDSIREARAVLNDESDSAGLGFPAATGSRPGDFARVQAQARVLDAPAYRLHFRERDSFTGPTEGYHRKQVLVDDVVVWDQDVAGGGTGWNDVSIDVTDQVKGKQKVRVAFRLYDRKGVGNFEVLWQPQDVRAEGLELDPLENPGVWTGDTQGAFHIELPNPAGTPRRRFHIPLIVMTAAQPQEFLQRHGEPASPDRIAAWARMALDEYQAGRCEGVVTYVLDKSPNSPVFPLVRNLFQEYSSVANQRPAVSDNDR